MAYEQATEERSFMNRQHWRCVTLFLLLFWAVSASTANAVPVKPQEQPSLPAKAAAKAQPAPSTKPAGPAALPAKSQSAPLDPSINDDRAFLDQLDQLPSPQSLTSDPLIQKAIECYKSGNLATAVPLLVQDLKEHPENGTAHFYLGLALKKMGQDANAINELETAIKICPPGVTQALANQALHGSLPPAQKKVAPPIWSTVLAAASGTLFGVETTATAHGVAFKPPDIAGPVSAAIKRGKQLLKNGGKMPPPQNFQPGAPRPYSSAADVMSMGDLMELAARSRSIDQKWRSDSFGVIRFAQAPEFTPEWDRWIMAFRKTFNRQLLRHLGNDYQNETSGTASMIFSLDKEGHLRGCIYQSTADDVCNQCLMKTIRDMNGTYVLAFPPTTHITGWNFNINWNFTRALAYIKAQKERQAIAEAKARSLAVEAKLKQQQLAEAQKAKALKLAQLATEAKLKSALQVKQKVSALLLPKAKPVELKATPVKLTDLPAVKRIPEPATPLTPTPTDSLTPPTSLTMDDIQDDDMDVSDLFK